MICSVMQPTFFPWIGYFDLIDAAKDFVFYDDVQFVKQSWQIRNRIKTANGVSFINIPVYKNSLHSNINQMEIDNSKPWKSKLLKSFFYTYQKSNYFKEIYPFMEELIHEEIPTLHTFNIHIIEKICKKIGIDTKLYLSSSLKSNANIKDERLVDICLELNCDTYLSTLGSASYIEEHNEGGAFTRRNINLVYHNYKPISYLQRFGDFEPYMSIVDVLFNVGFENTRETITKGRKSYLESKDI